MLRCARQEGGMSQKMIMVAICDDETTIGAELERALICIFEKMQIEYSIDVFFCGEDLCRHMVQGVHYDLIFLDLEFAKSEINGIEVGRIIRDTHQNDLVSIVYISWIKDYSFELFEIRPLNFLIKPLGYDVIEKTVRTYLKIAGLWSGEFSYKIGRDTFKTKAKDIVYIESRNKKLAIYFANGSIAEFYGAIKEVYQEQLKKLDFLFVHASYIVNFDYISAIRYDRVFLADSATPIPISQGRRNEIRGKYCEIMKRRRL